MVIRSFQRDLFVIQPVIRLLTNSSKCDVEYFNHIYQPKEKTNKQKKNKLMVLRRKDFFIQFLSFWQCNPYLIIYHVFNECHFVTSVHLYSVLVNKKQRNLG